LKLSLEATVILESSVAGGGGRGLATLSLTMRLCSLRSLYGNKLRSLPSGVFDKLTGLTSL
jgi:hypothetical protein